MERVRIDQDKFESVIFSFPFVGTNWNALRTTRQRPASGVGRSQNGTRQQQQQRTIPKLLTQTSDTVSLEDQTRYYISDFESVDIRSNFAPYSYDVFVCTVERTVLALAWYTSSKYCL